MKNILGIIIITSCFAQDTSKLDERIATLQVAFVRIYTENNKTFNERAQLLGETMNAWTATRNATMRSKGKIGTVEKAQWAEVVKAMDALDETGREWSFIKEKFDMLKETMKGEE